MTIGDFLEVCDFNQFMLQDESCEIGYMSREGVEKYFKHEKLKKLFFDEDEKMFLLTIEA